MQSGDNLQRNVPASVALSKMRIRLVIRRLQFRSQPGRQHSLMEIDHKIFSVVILSIPLIQGGQSSVSGERMGTILVKP